MRAITHVELSTDESSAAKLDAFFSALRINEADPLILAIEVPTLLRRLRSLLRSAAEFPLPATTPAELDPRRHWRSPAEQSVGISFDREVSKSRTHTAPAEFIAAGSAEITLTAPATGLTIRPHGLTSTPHVPSECSYPAPTAGVDEKRGGLRCLLQRMSGHPSARDTFFDEAEAQRLTLGPRLPHHRHRMTGDEFLAGLVLALVCLGAVIFAIARLV